MLTFALIAAALAQTPQHRLFLQPNLPRTSYAFFEFAPASGAGMGTACACTTPTGAKGEAMTFTRAGDATCSKQGLATTGIANGDLVVCTANQPRVESSGGVLGLRVEGARTSSVLRSEQLNDAAWTWENGGGAGATTRTSDFAIAPSGATTAERLEIPATSGVQYSDTYQTFSVSAAAATTCSVYVRGNGTSGTTDLCIYDGSTWLCQACSFVSGSWNRCSYPVAVGGGTTRFCKLGNNSNQNGGIARAAVDLLAWGAQGEEGAYATSYIPTVAAAVTRNAEAGYFTPLNGVAVGSISATMQGTGFRSDASPLSVSTDGDNRLMAYFPSAGATSALGNFSRLVAVDRTFSTGSVTAANTTRVVAYYPTSTDHGACINGTCATGAVAAYAQLTGTAATRIYIGSYLSSGFEIDGIITSACVDPSSSRCR